MIFTIAMIFLFFGAYFALSYREGMIAQQHQPIQQERIKLD